MVHAVACATAHGVKVSETRTKAAYGWGGGVDVGIGQKLGVLFDIRMISPRDMNWYVRLSTGLTIRLN